MGVKPLAANEKPLAARKKPLASEQNPVDEFVHRQALLGLLLAQVAALLLHIPRLPLGLVLLAALVLGWRLQIYRQRWGFPSPMVRSVLVLLSLLALISTYRQWYALEPMVALLIVAFLLKLLELEYRRDGVVLIFVGYFVSACAFLFDQGIVITLAGILVLWLLTACLLVLYGVQIRTLSRRTVRLVSLLLLQAVPLMLLMLFVFPRIGALWSVPLQGSSAITGVGESLAPGDFSQLSRSRQLAFRVSFDNDMIPDSAQRYWRGLVLTHFDGRRWQREQGSDYFDRPQALAEPVAANAVQFHYEVILEPTNQAWLYGIAAATITEAPAHQQNSLSSATHELWLPEPVTQRIQYRVSSIPSLRWQERPQRLQQSLVLPPGFNPRTLKTARAWRRQALSAEAYIDKVLDYYRQSFSYTLSPPLLGTHSVDEFLFASRRGFCEHFASSFVVLMRAAGIPARVVVGYQGGEWNAQQRYLSVRQYHAHAWAELWLPQRGWVRIDPTAAVSPHRIEQGLLEALGEEEQALVEGALLASFGWLKQWTQRWDGLNYRWQRWVLSYDQQLQAQWLQDLLGQVTAARVAVLLVAPALFFSLIIGLFTLGKRPPPRPKKVKLYHALVKHLQRRGVNPIPGETLQQYCQRAIGALPKQRAQLTALQAALSRSLYLDAADLDRRTYWRLRGAIGRL